MNRILVASIALLLSACSHSSEAPANTPPANGTYTGAFSFTQDGVKQSGAVTFVFNDGAYQCTPTSLYLPPAGAGSFKVAPGTMTLTDQSAHTAEFDWTLILNGDFKYTVNGSTIVLTQEDAQRNRTRRIELVRQN